MANATDRWAGQNQRVDGPASQALALDSLKSDTVELGIVTRGLSVNTDGNIVVLFDGDGTSRGGSGTAVTIAVLAGVVYPFRIRRLNSGSTSATGVIGYY